VALETSIRLTDTARHTQALLIDPQ
jgi:hypothetical protein